MLKLVLVLALVLAPSAPARAAEASAFTTALMRYLGLDPAKRLPDLEKGVVVHNGVSDQEKLPDEVAAAGAMLLVRGKSADDVIAAFLHAETFLEVHQVKRHQALQADASDDAAFAALPQPDPGDAAETVKAPRRVLNLSVSEGELLTRLDAGGPGLPGRVRTVLAEILAARLRAYAAQGLEGVAPYVRENGQVVDPRIELRAALASLTFIRDQFPGFLDDLTAAKKPRTYYWMERSVDKAQVLVLSAELRRRDGAAALGSDLHFYASREYNSMLTLVGVVPYADASFVFAVNHTFTEQVTGMGSSFRRSVARNMVASGLAKQLEATRNRLGP